MDSSRTFWVDWVHEFCIISGQILDMYHVDAFLAVLLVTFL